jgi:hypothetical protein
VLPSTNAAKPSVWDGWLVGACFDRVACDAAATAVSEVTLYTGGPLR